MPLYLDPVSYDGNPDAGQASAGQMQAAQRRRTLVTRKNHYLEEHKAITREAAFGKDQKDAIERAATLLVDNVKANKLTREHIAAEQRADADRLKNWAVVPPSTDERSREMYDAVRYRMAVRALALARIDEFQIGNMLSTARDGRIVPEQPPDKPWRPGVGHFSEAEVREMNDCHSPEDGKFCSGPGSGRGRGKKPRYQDEEVEYGGERMSRGSMVADLQKKAAAQFPDDPAQQRAMVSRYMQGHDRQTTLKKVNAGSPIITNAMVNRSHAVRMFKAGMTPDQIAKAFPEVFKTDEKGLLGQKYDYELNDGSGRKETNRMITKDAVDKVIRRHNRRGRDDVMRSMGMTKVKGARSGQTYWE